MFDWLWKKLGYHICSTFTPWQKMRAECVRQPVIPEFNYSEGKLVEYTRTWQERSCKECGKIQQEELEM